MKSLEIINSGDHSRCIYDVFFFAWMHAGGSAREVVLICSGASSSIGSSSCMGFGVDSCTCLGASSGINAGSSTSIAIGSSCSSDDGFGIGTGAGTGSSVDSCTYSGAGSGIGAGSSTCFGASLSFLKMPHIFRLSCRRDVLASSLYFIALLECVKSCCLNVG